ncbi:MAG: GNAT family N-acetyltransferase [Chloroflexota bacterium]
MFDDIRARYFPTELVPGIIARPVDAGSFWTLIERVPGDVFSSLSDLGNYEMPAARQGRALGLREVYANIHSEHIIFYDAHGEPVGWSTGVMVDPSTFFMSYTGVSPQYRRMGIYSAFLNVFMPYLYEVGYERVTSNHMVNNRAVLIAKLKAGFFITGTLLDERWGAQVSMVYLFHEDRRKGFASAFGLENYSGVPEYFTGEHGEPQNA